MNSKHVVFITLSVITISLIIAYLAFSDSETESQLVEASQPKQNELYLAQDNQVAKEVLAKNKTDSTDLLLSESSEESEESEVLTDEDEVVYSGITRLSDEAEMILQEAGVLPEDLSQEAYVEFDLKTLRELEVGDTFNLEIPQTSEMFSTEVTKIDKFNNGDKSVFGRLIGSDGVFHTSVLTVGVDAVYGQFTTVSGNYVFESKGKHGWIAAKRDLYKQHVEFQPVYTEASSEGSQSVIAPPQD